MPRALAMAVAMPLGGRLYNSIGPRPLIVAGLAVSAAAFWQMTSPSLNTNPASLLVPMIFQGFGLGLAFVAASTAAMGNLDRAQMTAASGLYNVIRQVCGSFGIALSATLLTRGYITNRTYLMEYVAALDGTSAVWLEQLQRYLAGRGPMRCRPSPRPSACWPDLSTSRPICFPTTGCTSLSASSLSSPSPSWRSCGQQLKSGPGSRPPAAGGAGRKKFRPIL